MNYWLIESTAKELAEYVWRSIGNISFITEFHASLSIKAMIDNFIETHGLNIKFEHGFWYVEPTKGGFIIIKKIRISDPSTGVTVEKN